MIPRTLLTLLCLYTAAEAATFPVTVFTDTTGTPSGGGAGAAGDLRNTINTANTVGGANSITFVCGAPPCTITLNGPLPPITSNMTIDGGTFGDIVIDGNNAYRVFFVDTGTVTLANLQIQNASAQGGAGGSGAGPGGGGAGFGAGLFVNQAGASVALESVLFKNVSVTGGAGGNAVNTSDLPGFSAGGGGGLGFAGAAGDVAGNSRGGGGGGGVTGAGGAFAGVIGGNGGAGGGGAGGSNGLVGTGAGGSAYAGNNAGSGGGSHTAGNGGFGGGGGGGECVGTAGAGGFGGGGGGAGSCFTNPGGNGGFGAGGGSGSGTGGSTAGAVGLVRGGAAGNGDNNTVPGGAGGGAASGPAVFVRLGSLTTLNSTSSGTSTANAGQGSAGPAGTTNGSNGTTDPTPVFNFGGTVNGSNATGANAAALPFSHLPATHFSVVSVTPVTSSASNTNGVTVTALDSTGATDTAYNGTVHLTSSDAAFVNTTGDSTLVNGVGSFTFTLKTAGLQDGSTATDTVLSNVTGTSNNVIVQAGPAALLVVSAPASTTAGVSLLFTVTAQDLAANIVTGYAGTVHFTSTDGSAVLPAPSTLTNGTGSFGATLNTAGIQTISANDPGNAVSGISGNISVSMGSAPVIPVIPFTVTPLSVSLQYVQNTAPSSFAQNFSVSSFGSGYSATSSAAWLVAPAGRFASGTYTVTVKPASLSPGVYQASVGFSSANGSATSLVTLTVLGPPVLAAQPAAILAAFFGTTPASQSIQLTSGSASVPFTAASDSSWLTFNVLGTTTPATLQIQANPSGLPVATYVGHITVTSAAAANSPYTIPVTFSTTGGGGGAGQAALLNAASFAPALAAPNTITTLFGPITCAAPQIVVGGVSASVLFSSATQVNFVVPGSALPGPDTVVKAICSGAPVDTATLAVAPVEPAIFTQTGSGAGQGSILNQDESVNSAANPAFRGGYAAVYVTGFGSFNPPSPDGLSRLSNTVTATVGGVNASVTYAGEAPGETAGLQQINIQIPANAPAGAGVPIVLTVDSVNTQSGVTIALQ